MSHQGQTIPIGKLLRADNSQFVAGCRVKELDTPALGALVKVKLEDMSSIYGLITKISIDDDGLVRQLVSGMSIPSEYTADNRYNRNLPVEIHVLIIGYLAEGQIHQRFPPRPPLSLDSLYLCDDAELAQFTTSGNYAYLRHILRLTDQPVEELLAAHLSQAKKVHETLNHMEWYAGACKKLVTLLKDDYTRLTNILDALAELE